jgi:hypothetical protein
VSHCVRALVLPCCLAALAAVAGCEPRNAVVGRDGQDGGTGGSESSVDGEAPGKPPSIFTQFETDEGLWDRQQAVPGATISFGVSDPAAEDGESVVLVIPGDPALESGDSTGPDLATQISTKQFVRFGTFRTRLRFPACAPGEEVASAAFAFRNDGTDGNGNGIADNPELDIHVLCGAPPYIVLTAWTDYDVVNGRERFLKASRAIDTRTGALFGLASETTHEYVQTGAAPELAVPGFPAPSTFYEVGFEWLPASVRFFIVREGVEITLWDLLDATYVPQLPLQLMFNLWHSETHWLPARTAADYPAQDAAFRIDWMAFTPD